MKQLKSLHCGNILNSWIDKLDITQAEIARKINRKPQQISNLIKTQYWNTEMLEKIANSLNMSISEFINLEIDTKESEETNNSSNNIPVVITPKPSGKSIAFYDVIVTGGNVSLFKDDNEKPAGYLYAPAFSDCIAIQLSGDSMEPIYKAGDILFIKEYKSWTDYMNWGQVYLIVTEFENMVKNVLPGTNNTNWTLRSYNPEYPDFNLPLRMVLRVFLVKGRIRQDAM
ncbi:MAG: S24 family peptidase [Siphonobacter sp.]